MTLTKRLFWPYTVDEWLDRFVDYAADPLRGYRLEEWLPFEEKLNRFLPPEEVNFLSEDLSKKLRSGVPPEFDQSQDVTLGKFFVSRNPWDHQDPTPHLALGVPFLTEGNQCDEIALLLMRMPRVTIFKDNGQIHYTGVLRPKYLSPELIAEAIVKEYWVLVHEMVCLHKEIPNHGLYLGVLEEKAKS